MIGATTELAGRVAIVTGANSGIGFEVARELARKGAHVALACRDRDRARSALDIIQSVIPEAQVTSLPLDLASLRSVRDSASAFDRQFDRLDILVNNAGVMVAPFGQTEDGFELHLGINHLGHFALTGLLIDRLLASPAPRVVTVTSAAYRFGRLDVRDLALEGRRGYSPFRAYARSKLANVLFAQELQRRLDGTRTISVVAHPGGAATGLGRRATESRFYRALLPIFERLSQSAAEGARSILRAATDPRLAGGELIAPGGFLGMRGQPVVNAVAEKGMDPKTGARLWEASEELTGVRFL